MRFRLLTTLAIMAILFAGSLSIQAEIPGDGDGDGVPDSVDVCPAENASFFDRDGDGCVDPDAGARHTEFWGVGHYTITYFINVQGSPDVSDGSDFLAIQNAMNAWPSIAGTELTAVYGGTTPEAVADALDQVNMVTFVDNEFPFSSLVLAVGITTSFTTDSLYNGTRYRAGEVVDADMIFNPSKTFKTPTSGPVGTDIQATATHEAGHMFGLAHTAVKSSTMYYVLPAKRAAVSLEADDELAYFKAYAGTASRDAANRIRGTVTNGNTLQPVPGAIVFAISVAGGDTTACEFTLPDGSYSFPGLPDGSYYIAIYPLDGSSPIGFIQPGNINAMVDSTAEAFFVPEYWDNAESSSDDASAKDFLTVAGGSTVTADLVTNVDSTAPTVLTATPAPGSSDVAIDGAYVIRFSEGLDIGTIQQNFKFYSLPDSGGIAGNIAVLSDDSVLAFTPKHPLQFTKSYELLLKPGLKDKSGNGLSSAYVLGITTEAEPPLSILSLSPNKGVPGNTVVINGAGFDTAVFPTVKFRGHAAAVLSAGPNQLVVTVPNFEATTGPVTVTNSDLTTSNSLTFTVLSRAEIARGYETGAVQLGSTPNEITVVPDGGYAYVAAAAGAEAVVVDPGLAGYLTNVAIPYAGGLNAIATTPEGTRVYAVSKTTSELVEIMSDPSTGIQFNTVLSSHAIGDVPLGIAVGPAGRRAYIPTDDAEIQIWDIELGSPTYQQAIGVLTAPGSLAGKLDFTPAGDRLLALTGAGDLLVYDVPGDSLLAKVAVGIEPYDVVVDPVGQRAYVSHANGDVSVVSLSEAAGPFQVQDIVTGGSLRGLDITPGAMLIYGTDRELDQIKIIDLDEMNPTFRTVISDFDQLVNPIDLILSPDGIYAFSLLQGDGTASNRPKMIVNTIGIGPTLFTVYPKAAPVGAQIVLRGMNLGVPLTPSLNFMEFSGGVTATTTRQELEPETQIVTIPPGAQTGPIRFAFADQRSNELYLTVLDSTGSSAMRFAGSVGPTAASEFEDAIAINPQGTLAFVGGSDGVVHAFDIDPSSPTFHQSLGRVQAVANAINDMAITADGKKMFVVSRLSTSVPVISVDRNAQNFMKGIDLVHTDPGGFDNPSLVATSPNNEMFLIYEEGANEVRFGFSYSFIDTVMFGGTPLTNVFSMAFHRNGLRAYLGRVNPNEIVTVDMDPWSGNFGALIETYPIPLTGTDVTAKSPVSMCPTPDGEFLLVQTVQLSGPAERAMLTLNAPSSIIPNPSDALTLVSADLIPFGSTATPTYIEQVLVSPRGDRVVYSLHEGGIYNYAYGNPPSDNINAVGVFEALSPLEMAFTPDGSRLYVASSLHDSLRVFDFNDAQILAKTSGDAQTGIEFQVLPAPLRARVTSVDGDPIAGIPVTFEVTAGGGLLSVAGGSSQVNLVTASDPDGYADVNWRLGGEALTQTVSVTAEGLSGSPLSFGATAVVDPATLPLQLAENVPLANAVNVSVTTAIQSTFSKTIDAATIGPTSLFLRRQTDGTTIATAYGYTDGYRKVALTPIVALDYGTTYEIVATAAVQDTSGGSLTNPTVSSFTTTPPPPQPTVASASPPSALTGVSVIINGSGFNPTPSNNTVMFNGAQATPTEGSVSYLRVTVPKTAVTGPVSVSTGGNTSNTVPFAVLVPSNSPIDDVIASVGSGSGTKSLAVTPDGAIAYTVSTESDAVIPIDVDGQSTYGAIQVGDQPVAIVIHPDGTFAYVANFGTSTVSVIDIRPGDDFNQVIQTIVVGTNPIDIVVLPDGQRVITANAGSSDLSVIDGNSGSATHHTVLATVGSSSGAKSLAVSPDGARIYVGTDNGFLVMEASGYTVLATVGSSSGAKSLAVSPDGTLLYVLTNSGEVLIVDVEPGSSSENTVLATVGAGSGAKSLAVSPDGGLLYLIQEDSNNVIVVSVTIEGGASALEDPAFAPQFRVTTAVVDTVATGNDPSDIAFDPTGTGVVIITQAGENEVLILNGSPFPQGPLTAAIEVHPQTLNLESRGRYVTGIIELPFAFAPEEIVIGSVRLNGVIPALEDKWEIKDIEGDGIRELIVKFDREHFQSVLPLGEYVPVTINGDVRDRTFAGEDTIRTIRPTVTHPTAASFVGPNALSYVAWTSPTGYAVDKVDVHCSTNDGASWQPIAVGAPDAGRVDWQTPDVISETCRVMVTLYKGDEVLGMGMSELFTISAPVAVVMQSIAVVVESGTAVMRWETTMEYGVLGFHVVRSDARDGVYTRVTNELVPAAYGGRGGAYEFRDDGVRPNRTYWYKLQEVSDLGPGAEFGPYEVEFKISNSLAQNTPNPFNPTTTIQFSVAADANVRLRIYDVAGRLVRTLVDEPKQANFYKVSWDGRNDQGQRVASGVYLYRLEAGDYVSTRKMMLLK